MIQEIDQCTDTEDIAEQDEFLSKGCTGLAGLGEEIDSCPESPTMNHQLRSRQHTSPSVSFPALAWA